MNGSDGDVKGVGRCRFRQPARGEQFSGKQPALLSFRKQHDGFQYGESSRSGSGISHLRFRHHQARCVKMKLDASALPPLASQFLIPKEMTSRLGRAVR
jgi:hypothetical protein